MTIYTFSLLVTFDVATYGSAANRYLDGTLTRCVVQACHRQYFPGMLSRAKQPRPTPAVHAQLSVALNDGEAESFFAPGQRFTVWTDAIVGTTVCGDGFIGHGVIKSHKSSAPPIAGADRTQRTAASPVFQGPWPRPLIGRLATARRHRSRVSALMRHLPDGHGDPQLACGPACWTQGRASAPRGGGGGICQADQGLIPDHIAVVTTPSLA